MLHKCRPVRQADLAFTRQMAVRMAVAVAYVAAHIAAKRGQLAGKQLAGTCELMKHSNILQHAGSMCTVAVVCHNVMTFPSCIWHFGDNGLYLTALVHNGLHLTPQHGCQHGHEAN